MKNSHLHHQSKMLALAGVLVVLGVRPGWAINYGEPVPPNEFQTVGHVLLYDREGTLIGHGTGTLIDQDLVLTAAHVVASAPSPYHVAFQLDHEPKNLAHGIAYRTHPEFYDIYQAPPDAPGRANLDGFQVIRNDVALIKLDRKFPKNLAYHPIANRIPPPGTPATAIGYGRDETRRAENTGVRKKGRLKYQRAVEDVLLFVAADQKNQRTDSGDSGGPLLLETPTGWELLALVNGHDLREKVDGYAFDEYGYYVSLKHQSDWINTARQELDAIAWEPAAPIFVLRNDPTNLHLALTARQYVALANAGIRGDRLSERLLRRGLAEPLSAGAYKTMREAGLSEKAFFLPKIKEAKASP